ncbi:DeoR/GlpR family DNA-binding transcription regulator [Bacillus sp. UMB0893]|uniref:DeoR/GlpR family DNA-binding transcription regulator n=1 Tax=Bacillus sp. UMB0893 TaxID=2066053 RepID=UPI000C75817C|nr:DeoR/GlpR family DNA-binding transcription regulator [Bacillus sp. UMB0893]PLR69120.1 DeoR/GlpR transcriptional regulator [Bacillus sp. UMB0893]
MKKSLTAERYKVIIRELEMKNKIGVVELAIKLNVTPETIRKDLSALEEKKKLRRIHGGAIQYFGVIKEPHFNKKVGIFHLQKKMIGEAAATFIMDGDLVALDVGTTTFQIASSIKDVKNVTIVTNSLAAAELLNNRIENRLFDGKVIVLGGISNPLQRSISGSITNKLLEQFYFDKAFISCGGISMDGICDFNVDEASASSIMMKRSKQVYVVADSSKLNQRALFNIGSFSAIDCLITDQKMPIDWLKDPVLRDVDWVTVGDLNES